MDIFRRITLQSSRIRLSMRSQHLLSNLKSKTGLPINVLARYGIILSIRDSTIPNADIYDERGMELPIHILFGKHDKNFYVIFKQRLSDDNLNFDKYYDRMLRAHLNRGATMLFPRISDLDDFVKLADVS